MSARSFNAPSYKYGFNGKENDPETGTQDYGMRIYNPVLGRFLSVDPLAKTYSYYSPYQFAGNLPTKYVDIDGMEEGKLVINDPEARIATLTWTKVYYVVSTGVGMVHSQNLLNDKEVNSTLKSGANTIYTNVLPTSKNSKGEFAKVKSMPKDAWENGKKTWKINVVFEIKFVTTDENGNLVNVDYAKQKTQENPLLNGIIKDENKLNSIEHANFKEGNTVLAAANTSNDPLDTDLIHTNDTYFGATPQPVPTALTATEAITHEIGHTFGLNHYDGDYSFPGLMSNEHEKVKPTKDNNVEIINKNIGSIKTE
jgi:RHS repeat-associated protein